MRRIIFVTLCVLLLGTATSCNNPSPSPTPAPTPSPTPPPPTLIYFPSSGPQSPTVGAYAKGGTTIKWYVSDKPFNIEFVGGAAPCKNPATVIEAIKGQPATCEVVVPKGADPNTVFSYQYKVIFDPNSKKPVPYGPFPDHVGNCDGCTPDSLIELPGAMKPAIRKSATTAAATGGGTYGELISCSGSTANVKLPSQDVSPLDYVSWQSDDAYTWVITFKDASICPVAIDQNHNSCHIAMVPPTKYPYTVIVSKNGTEVCRSNPETTNLNVVKP
jgi:hypothetical protein